MLGTIDTIQVKTDKLIFSFTFLNMSFCIYLRPNLTSLELFCHLEIYLGKCRDNCKCIYPNF